jgi:hypothetical protein
MRCQILLLEDDPWLSPHTTGGKIKIIERDRSDHEHRKPNALGTEYNTRDRSDTPPLGLKSAPFEAVGTPVARGGCSDGFFVVLYF